MKYSPSTVLALSTAAAAGTGARGWSVGRVHGPSSLLVPLMMMDDDLTPTTSQPAAVTPQSLSRRMIERQRELARTMFDLPSFFRDDDDFNFLPSPSSSLSRLASSSLSPMSSFSPSQRYELVDNDTKFELSIDVPGIEMDNLDVTIDEDRRYLTVSGQRSVSSTSSSSSSSSRFESKFSQTFSLDDAVELDKFTAQLKNGVLAVSAPKKVLEPPKEEVPDEEEHIKRIPIMSAESSTDAKVADPIAEVPTPDAAETVVASTKDEEMEETDDTVMDLDEDTATETKKTNKVHVEVKES